MTRYWEPNEDHPSIEMLKDWVSDNVIAAQQDLMDEGDGWLEVKDGRLVFSFVSSEYPNGDVIDVWMKDFDAIDMLWRWLSDYGPYESLSPAQKAHVESRAKALDDFAAEFRQKAGLPPKDNSTPAA